MSPARDLLARLGLRRLVTGSLIAATLGVVLLIGDPTASDPGRTTTATPDPSPASPTTTPADPASVDEFCASFAELTAAHGAAITETTVATVTRLREVAATTRDLARRTAAMPPDAVLGISFVLDLFEDLPDDATSAELTSSGHVPTFAEEAQADAFVAFVADACPAPTTP